MGLQTVGEPRGLDVPIRYRPISLSNYIYTIVAKVLSNRLSTRLSDVISDSQSAFLKGRYILDSLVATQEIIHHTRSHGRGVLLKLDFDKAFIRLNWVFLMKMLHAKGFSDKWQGWILDCMSTSKLACSINGDQGPEFKMKRGIMHGCPLSPYLFIVAMDVFDDLIKRSISSSVIKGLGDTSWPTSNLHFADDMLLFCEVRPLQISALKVLLYGLKLVSGLSVSLCKSTLYFIGNDSDAGNTFATMLNYKCGVLQMKYLGLPLSDRSLPRNDWRNLIKKIDSKLEGWKGKMLSLGGRLTLLNSVITTLSSYFMSYYFFTSFGDRGD